MALPPVSHDTGGSAFPGCGSPPSRAYNSAMASINIKPRLSSGGAVAPIDRGWRLSIPAGGATRYRLAQLDDHQNTVRSRYPYGAPVHFELDGRVSAANLPGTWGFGLWNDPYGVSFVPGNGLFRFPALPNALWFFNSSPLCYLSFRDDKPGNGFLAQVFSSPGFDPLLIRAVLTFPFSRRRTRKMLARLIDEDGVRLDPRSGPAPFDVTAWHHYAMDWTEGRTRLTVDDTCMLETPISPRGRLGIVIWIDNQFAGYTPQGKVSFGVEPNPAAAWMEIRDISVT